MKKVSVGEERVGSHTITDRQQQEIDQVKGVCAACIDNLEFLKQEGGARARTAAIAQTRFEEACMWAVRAITKPHGR